jgi:putative PIN family toxin of toxin-antitoxin system
MRILLDTNILARAAAGPPGPAHELLLLATQHDHVLVLSPFLIAELTRVLRYDRLRPVHGMTDEQIDQFVDDLVLVADLVDPHVVTGVSQDPDDDAVIAAAKLGRAQVLSTLDRHLHAKHSRAYCAALGIEVLTDVDLLSRLRSVKQP